MFQNILAAVDQSPRAEGVVRAAHEIATRFGGRVHLYTALAVPPEFPAAAANHPDGLIPYLTSHARTGLESLAAGRERIQIEPAVVLHGQPWRDILAVAERLHSDLIVIGSHGYGGWDRLLGTTAGKIANNSTRPVLIVHETPQES